MGQSGVWGGCCSDRSHCWACGDGDLCCYLQNLLSLRFPQEEGRQVGHLGVSCGSLAVPGCGGRV